jgi:hypothetical protein
MNFLLSITIILTSLFELNYSFTKGIWRGTTLFYQKGLNNNLDFNNIIYSYNITKLSIRDKKPNILNLRLRSYDKLGGVFSNIPKTHNWNIDNNKSYVSEINFFQDTTRSLIIFNYTYDNFNKLELTSIKTSALRCGGIKKYRMRLRIMNISNFLNLIMKFNYCKTTIINPYYPNTPEIKYSKVFDYTYFFTNEDRINSVFTDNLIISLPSIIYEYKPFTFIIGCFISVTNYKQLNINYNYDGKLISMEYNEYKCE